MSMVISKVGDLHVHREIRTGLKRVTVFGNALERCPCRFKVQVNLSPTTTLSNGPFTGHPLTKSISLAMKLRWTLKSYHANGTCRSNTSHHRTSALQFKGKRCMGDQSKADLVCAHAYMHMCAQPRCARGTHDNACTILVAHSQTQTSTNRAGGSSGSGCASPWH